MNYQCVWVASCVLLLAVTVADHLSDPSAIYFEGRVFTDEYARHALSWPYSRAGVLLRGSTRVTAVLEDSGFDTTNPHSTVSFSAGSTKDFKVTREDGLLKLTLAGLDPDIAVAALLTKLSESDDGGSTAVQLRN